jgi:hypothetical protein
VRNADIADYRAFYVAGKFQWTVQIFGDCPFFDQLVANATRKVECPLYLLNHLK